MNVARISELDRRITQSGRANAGLWLLEFERKQGQVADPLTGWSGSGDTNTQIKLTFRTREEAVAYAERNKIPYHIVPATPVKLKIQAYADNFR